MMADVQWLSTAIFLAAGAFAFLMLLSGARRGLVARAEAEQRQREEEEAARRKAERETVPQILEARGVD